MAGILAQVGDDSKTPVDQQQQQQEHDERRRQQQRQVPATPLGPSPTLPFACPSRPAARFEHIHECVQGNCTRISRRAQVIQFYKGTNTYIHRETHREGICETQVAQMQLSWQTMPSSSGAAKEATATRHC